MMTFFSFQRSGSELPYRKADQILDVAGAGLTLMFVALCVYFYFTSDASVPIHFNGAGEPDAWGEPDAYFLMGGLSLFLWGCCFGAARNPKYIHIPVAIRRQRAVVQNYWKCHFTRWLLLACLLMFFFLLLQMRRWQMGMEAGWLRMGFASSFVLLFGVLAAMCWRVYRAGKE